jgi:pterin-4a-carbinolamine dehydratase
MQPFTFFISYRREDTAPIALLLKSEIERRIQFVRVYVDVESVGLAEPFPERIAELIGEAHATIALISKGWMPPRAHAGNRRVAHKRPDWVLTELEQATNLPIKYRREKDRHGLRRRLLLPIFIDCEKRFDQFEIPRTISGISTTNAERIDHADWPNAIGPLIERIAVKLKLKKRPDADEYPTPDGAKARTQPVADEELASVLQYKDYDGWYVDNFGSTDVRYLVKTFKFRHFNEAADFMALVSDHCRVLNHHPEWRNVFNHVTVSLTTWDARRRVTIYDLNLALYMNKAAEAIQIRK